MRSSATNPRSAPPSRICASARPNRRLFEPRERVARREGFRCIAGIDEVGRGPWAGPVVAAAVILRSGRFIARIDDSKRLTPRQRLRAAAEIQRQAWVGVGIVGRERIDRSSIVAATLDAMRQAVEALPHRPDLLLIDGDIQLQLPISQQPLVHGDQRCLSIACASIIAKVLRDELMAFYDRLFPAYGFARHKGYGTAEHQRALTRCGPSLLHRVTFQPIRGLHP